MLLSVGSACLRPIPLHGCFCLSFCLSVFLSFCLSVCLSVWLTGCAFVLAFKARTRIIFFTFKVRTFWQSEVKISVLALWLGALSSLFHNMGVGGMDVILSLYVPGMFRDVWKKCPHFECVIHRFVLALNAGTNKLYTCVYIVSSLWMPGQVGVCVLGGCVGCVCVWGGSVCLSVSRSVGLSVCLSVGRSVCLPACICLRRYICSVVCSFTLFWGSHSHALSRDHSVTFLKPREHSFTFLNIIYSF